MTLLPRLSILIAICALCVPAAAESAGGDLDPTFGSGGLVTTDFAARGDFGLAVALQSDGKLVVAGNSSRTDVFNVDFAVARYNADGSLDPTFGSGGEVLTDFGTRIDAAFDVAVQPDGKIVAVGNSASDFAVARYNADGSLDASFGRGGLVVTDFGSSEQATGVALQPDGKLVVVGFDGSDFVVLRYNADGSLDSTFGSGGRVATDLGGSAGDGAFDVAVGPGGTITVGGGTGFFPSTGDFALARYNADGSLDTSFGTGGKVTTDFGGADRAFAIGVAADGVVTAAGGTTTGTGTGDFALARYRPDGTLDSSFGAGGKVTTAFAAGNDDTAFGLILAPDGSATAVGGSGSFATGSTFALAQFTSAGALDSAFGSGGKVTTAFSGSRSTAWDIVRQPDGKLVVAGGTNGGINGDFALARYLVAPTVVRVSLDVKPESADNVIPLQSNGLVAVAVLATEQFDVATIDQTSLCFVQACVEVHGHGHIEDVNGDGRADLLLHYAIAATGIKLGDKQACLTGRTQTGLRIEGCDAIDVR
jgi:uncharacterized delta-60 repeat protein